VIASLAPTRPSLAAQTEEMAKLRASTQERAEENWRAVEQVGLTLKPYTLNPNP
jgi:hypothetical protein